MPVIQTQSALGMFETSLISRDSDTNQEMGSSGKHTQGEWEPLEETACLCYRALAHLFELEPLSALQRPATCYLFV